MDNIHVHDDDLNSRAISSCITCFLLVLGCFERVAYSPPQLLSHVCCALVEVVPGNVNADFIYFYFTSINYKVGGMK